MSHVHHHHAHHRPPPRRVLYIALGLTFAFMLVEVAAGWLTHSLALLSDAGHMFTDAVALLLSLLAFWFSARPVTPDKTYGMHRIEVLAASANGFILIVISGYIIAEAVTRFSHPPAVDSLPMVLVAGAGLLVNLLVAWLLFKGAQDNLNIKGAFLHVVGDALGSVGAITAGLIMLWTRWYAADAIISIFIASIIIYSACRLILESTHILMEGTPAAVDTAEVRQAILAIPGIHNLHDLHIWCVTSGYNALSAHLIIDDPAEGCRYIEQVRHLVQHRWHIEHVTIQIEDQAFHAREEKEMIHL